MLYGTSRIGQRYAVILHNQGGKAISVRWQPGQEINIPGHTGYKVRSVAYRLVEISYPDTNPCRKSDGGKGVECAPDGKSARVTMQRAKPSAPAPVAQATTTNPPSVAPAPPPMPAQALTPEQIQQKEEEEKKWRERYQNFTPPTRIKDEDVPPGMKVVRTPFGDRLVPAAR